MIILPFGVWSYQGGGAFLILYHENTDTVVELYMHSYIRSTPPKQWMGATKLAQTFKLMILSKGRGLAFVQSFERQRWLRNILKQSTVQFPWITKHYHISRGNLNLCTDPGRNEITQTTLSLLLKILSPISRGLEQPFPIKCRAIYPRRFQFIKPSSSPSVERAANEVLSPLGLLVGSQGCHWDLLTSADAPFYKSSSPPSSFTHAYVLAFISTQEFN